MFSLGILWSKEKCDRQDRMEGEGKKENRTEGEKGREDRGRRKIKDTISSVNIIRIQL